MLSSTSASPALASQPTTPPKPPASPVGLTWSQMDRLEEPLRRFLATRCRDEAQLDDVLQETFLRCARYRSSLRNPDRLLSWAFRISTNVLLDMLRKDARFEGRRDLNQALGALPAPPSDPLEGSMCVAGTELPKDEAVELLGRALRDLGGRDRALVEQHYLGSPRTEQLPEAVHKVRLYRARRRLAAAFQARLKRQELREALACS